MTTLVYAPEVTIRIQTSKESRGGGEVIDVSADAASGSVTRIVNGVSTAEFKLLNQSRKYDGMFSPMDKVVIYFKRLRTMVKFTGYLDSVPRWSAVPGSLNLRASCTLKILQNYYWDPTSVPATELLSVGIEQDNYVTMEDGGLSQVAIDVLTKVVGWPKGQIHIGRVPNNWIDTVSKVADELVAESEAAAMAATVGTNGYVYGTNPAIDGFYQPTGIGTGTGAIPARSGKISYFAGPGNTDATGNMALTGEPGTNPRDPWYCAMRWGYVAMNSVSGAKDWWVNRKILVVNPKNNKAVVLRAADWGPAESTGRVIDVSKHALDLLGAVTDSVVNIGFAPPDANLGPVKTTKLGDALATSTTPVGSSTSAGPIYDGWGAAGDTSNLVTVHAGGCTFTVHRLAAPNFTGFVNDLVTELGYHPKSIGGYANRNIAYSSSKSNHAWGAAIDIDPSINPVVYGDGATAPYALPKPPAIINLARKWGLGWGGEWYHKKDYMHFEVIGAPASSEYTNTDGTTSQAGTTSGTSTGGTTPDLTTDQALSGEGLFNVYQYLSSPGDAGILLGGIRALLNDTPVNDTIQQLMGSGMREYCSAPNGDFIAWFPDHFGHYDQAGKMIVTPLEIAAADGPPTIGWSDTDLKTHQFVSGSSTPYTQGDAAELVQQMQTAGIASVETPELLMALLNISREEAKALGTTALQRYGARPAYTPLDQISGPRQEFFFACHKFMENWSAQYQASINLTFMPELFPGMLLCIPDYGIQGYVYSTTDSWSLSGDGSFTTNASCAPWSSIGRAKTEQAKGLPVGAPL